MRNVLNRTLVLALLAATLLFGVGPSRAEAADVVQTGASLAQTVQYYPGPGYYGRPYYGPGYYDRPYYAPRYYGRPYYGPRYYGRPRFYGRPGFYGHRGYYSRRFYP